MEPICVLLVEDDPRWQRGLTEYLMRQTDLCVVGHCATKEEAIQFASGMEKVDIILMDICLAGSASGIEATLEICQFHQAKVIMLTSLEDDHFILDSYGAGAVNYIVKSNFEEIPNMIRSTYYHNPQPRFANKILKEFRRLVRFEKSQLEMDKIQSLLTPTEINILKLMVKECSQKEIAEELFISVGTVKKHVSSIMRKLECKSSQEVVKKVTQIIV
ncbi:response regulator transcription factor [Baia soyae]|nr:response regulator transcription factor [Baia soyae]